VKAGKPVMGTHVSLSSVVFRKIFAKKQSVLTLPRTAGAGLARSNPESVVSQEQKKNVPNEPFLFLLMPECSRNAVELACTCKEQKDQLDQRRGPFVLPTTPRLSGCVSKWKGKKMQKPFPAGSMELGPLYRDFKNTN
jgi:hypothetical protein